MLSSLPFPVERLWQELLVEREKVEYKSTFEAANQGQILRTVCAFANDLSNLNGGYLVLGLAEEDGQVQLPPAGLDPGQLDSIQKKIIEGCETHLRPKYLPQFNVELYQGKHLLVLRCPGGDARPYRCSADRDRTEPVSWVRVGPTTKKPNESQLRQLEEVSQRIPFDDRRHVSAELSSLSWRLVQEHLRSTQSALASRELPPETVYRQLLLSREVDGQARPRNVALLFFTDDPSVYFPGAYLESVHFPQGLSGNGMTEQAHRGPLPAQVNSCLAWLQNRNPTHRQKQPHAAEALQFHAWPPEALREALVNAVYHRGYDGPPDPVKVRVLPDRLEVTSYPGPVAGLRLADLERDQVPPLSARNRRIGEFLKERGLAEAHGTGLAKIQEAMARNGSPRAVFDFPAEHPDYFRVTLPIHPAFLPKPSTTRGQPLRLEEPAPAGEVVGRAAWATEVWASLNQSDVHLVAPPGRGSSSALNLLKKEAPAPWQAALWNLGQPTVEKATAQLAVQVAAEGWAVPNGASIERLLEALDQPGRVLLVDNLDFAGGPDLPWHEPWDELIEADGPRRLVVFHRAPGSGLQARAPERLVLMPLGTADTRTLAEGLLVGGDLEVSDEVLEALDRLSAGLPKVLVHLVARLLRRRRVSVEDVEEAYDDLLVDPRDPAGLARRAQRWRGDAKDPEWAAALDLLLRYPDGLDRAALVKRLVVPALPRFEVLQLLRAATEAGDLVVRDGHWNFEHPLLREAWAAYRLRDRRGAYD